MEHRDVLNPWGGPPNQKEAVCDSLATAFPALRHHAYHEGEGMKQVLKPNALEISALQPEEILDLQQPQQARLLGFAAALDARCFPS